MTHISKIQSSWDENADEWVRIMERQLISSRKFTNVAIVERLLEIPSKKILDCGCGEGWLSRKMTEHGRNCTGIDFTPKLLEVARSKGPETFFHIDYSTIATKGTIPGAPYDTIVFNFSIYQKEGLTKLLQACSRNLSPDGFLLIQTLHPHFLEQQGLANESQWMADSWKGLPGNFSNGHHWYARTREDWNDIFQKSGLRPLSTQEIKDNHGTPLSILFTLKSL